VNWHFEYGRAFIEQRTRLWEFSLFFLSLPLQLVIKSAAHIIQTIMRMR